MPRTNINTVYKKSEEVIFFCKNFLRCVVDMSSFGCTFALLYHTSSWFKSLEDIIDTVIILKTSKIQWIWTVWFNIKMLSTMLQYYCSATVVNMVREVSCFSFCLLEIHICWVVQDLQRSCSYHKCVFVVCVSLQETTLSSLCPPRSSCLFSNSI